MVISLYPFLNGNNYSSMYGMLTNKEIESARESARKMFYFAYDNYMLYAYPKDELDPIHCVGRGHDHDNPTNINVNDALGDYSLSLVESLDSLVVLGNRTEFHKAVQLVIQNLSFDRNVTVQVFEATIRVIGSLLSAHLILTDENHLLGNYWLNGYDNELLTLAHDLANRLLHAFEHTDTGLPYPRVNLLRGVSADTINETCTAGAGSLLVEFGILSRLLSDPSFENAARRTVVKLWELRDDVTGLLGNVINIQTGQWRGFNSGIGAGIDSFYEYLLKSYILFGKSVDLGIFQEAYKLIMQHMRRGRDDCVNGLGDPPLFVNIDMRDGSMINTWIDSLQASFAAVLVLNGDIDEAICLHAVYYALWKKYDAIPERFNWYLRKPEVFFYPLRPEFVESTYMLYRATKNPFYMHVGLQILQSLDTFTKVKCGYATIHNVVDKTLEDRMESFFLSETAKYLFLLFDVENIVNQNEAKVLFTTEGHIILIDKRLQNFDDNSSLYDTKSFKNYSGRNVVSSCQRANISNARPPLDEYRFNQLIHLTGS